ncbi:MAG: hypothetical protein KBG91_08150 [Syntrophomonadaceae bacterium]|nr:hypothetical protein [Syntrophomonadaceae bacterium]
MRPINKARWIIVITLAVVVVAGLLSTDKIHDYYIKSKLEPQIELDRAYKNMAAVTSYKYSLLSTFTVDQRKEVISEVQGEKQDGNTHIKGEMVNTPVDIYYIDRTIYNYDSFANKWLVIPSNTSNSEELLISELNPLSNFRFKQVSTVEKLGFEVIDGTECLLVKCEPSVENQLLETMWKDFEYNFWIDFHKGLIKQAQLKATNKKMTDTKLNVRVKFFDLNKKIKIQAPDTTVKN